MFKVMLKYLFFFANPPREQNRASELDLDSVFLDLSDFNAEISNLDTSSVTSLYVVFMFSHLLSCLIKKFIHTQKKHISRCNLLFFGWYLILGHIESDELGRGLVAIKKLFHSTTSNSQSMFVSSNKSTSMSKRKRKAKATNELFRDDEIKFLMRTWCSDVRAWSSTSIKKTTLECTLDL